MDTQKLLDTMSLEEKVGQMFMLAFAGSAPEQAREMLVDRYVGACYISQDNAVTPQQAWDLSAALQQMAGTTPKRIPLILGVDQEGAWGVMVPYSCTGPGNMALGAANDPGMTSQMYRVIGQELSAVGYNTLLAPCVDVNSNPVNVIVGPRSFGEFHERVARHSQAAVLGAHEGGVITTVKHYPGHGDTRQDSHRLLPTVDRTLEELEEIDLQPYREAISAGVDIVMTAHILYPKIDPEYPATMSSKLLEGILRHKLGFRGVILSDSMNMFAIRQNYEPGEAAVLAVMAGVDMIMLAEEHYDHSGAYLEKQRATIDGILNGVRSGRIPMARIDQAVSRILDLKARSGLFERKQDRAAVAMVGSAANRAIESRSAELGVTLVRDAKGLMSKIKTGRLALIQATPQKAYEILTRTRGIGPNQGQPAFDAFRDEFAGLIPDMITFTSEEITAEGPLPEGLVSADLIVVVTEDYPLPGVDFDTLSQKQVVKRLIAGYGDKMIVVGLRPPYEFADFSGLGTYLTTCSSRLCAARAAARALAGVIPCRGVLPVGLAVD
jgi:beta-N-acetylhexosaminidase